MTHQFNRSLEYSHRQADAPYWEQVYRCAFPDMVQTLDLRHDGWHQRAGRDRAVVLSSGRTLYVDEKVRSRTYSDVALEIWSQYPKSGLPPYESRPGAVLGWACKPLDCDYLAYAFEPSQICYLFPFFSVRAAWTRHRLMWRDKAQAEEDGYRWVVAENRTYNTISIAVPIVGLRAAMDDALTISWRDAA